MPDNRGQGMNWIRLEKRLAIYHRDNFDCIWCRGVFPLDLQGYGLTLDHLDGAGGNGHQNLVTACHWCNTSRNRMPLEDWLKHLRKLGHRGAQARMRAAIATPLKLEAGKYLASLRRRRLDTVAA